MNCLIIHFKKWYFFSFALRYGGCRDEKRIDSKEKIQVHFTCCQLSQQTYLLG